MIEALYDSDKKCIAWIEWTLCDINGTPNEDGLFIYIYNTWSWKDGNYKKLIKNIWDKAPNTAFVYYWREKYNRQVVWSKRRYLKWAVQKKRLLK